jgi:hypothetical protein
MTHAAILVTWRRNPGPAMHIVETASRSRGQVLLTEFCGGSDAAWPASMTAYAVPACLASIAINSFG